MIVALKKYTVYRVVVDGEAYEGYILVTDRLNANPCSERMPAQLSIFLLTKDNKPSLRLETYYSSIWTEAMTKEVVEKYKIEEV